MRERGWKWNQTTVWSVEGDRRPLRLAEAIDLASLLGVAIDELLVDPLTSLLSTREAELERAELDRDKAAGQARHLAGPVAALRAIVSAHSGVNVDVPTIGAVVALEAFGDVPWQRTSAVLRHLGVPDAAIERLGALYRAWAERPLDASYDPMAGEPKPLDSPDFALWLALWDAVAAALPSLHAQPSPGSEP